MNHPTRTWLVAALFAATVSSQTTDPQQALARARVLATQEGDLAAAQQAYRALLDDPSATAVHAEAALHLGTLLWRLDQHDVATPLLQRAVAAGGDAAAAAAQVLAGQDPDGKQAAAQATQAQELAWRLQAVIQGPRNAEGALTEAGNRTLGLLRDELLALGEAAAQALAIADPLPLRLGNGQPDLFLAERAALLWRLGGPTARDSLRRMANLADPEYARFFGTAVNVARMAADLEPVLLEYLAGADATGEILQHVASTIHRLPHARAVALLSATNANHRAAGLHAIAGQWQDLPESQQHEFLQQHGDRVGAATRDADRRVVRAAWGLLWTFLGVGPAAAQLRFFAEVERLPADRGKQRRPERVVADDHYVTQLAATARRLGASADLPVGSLAGEALGSCAMDHVPQWGPRGAEAMLTLLELGYVEGQTTTLVRAAELADVEQLPRLIHQLGSLRRPQAALDTLAQRRLPAPLFPHLRALAESCFGPGRDTWLTSRPSSRLVQGQTLRVLKLEGLLLQLLQVALQTKAPEAAPWLAELAEQHAGLVEHIVELLARTAATEPSPELQAAMRRLLVWPGSQVDAVQDDERTILLATLLRLGDRDTLPLLARAAELGLAVIEGMKVPTSGREPWLRQLRGASFAFLGEMQGALRGQEQEGRSRHPWHGYRDADLLAGWRILLEAPVSNRLWAEWSRGVTQGGSPAGRWQVPPAVLPLLLERLPALWPQLQQGSDDLANAVLERVGEAMQAVGSADLAPGQPLRLGVERLLQGPATPLAGEVFANLPQASAAELAAAGRRLVRELDRPSLLGRMVQLQGIELTAEDWLAVLAQASRPMRSAALGLLPPTLGNAAEPALRRQLADDDPGIRTAACRSAARVLGAAGVPLLLPLLQDSDSNVSTVARAVLDVLRQDAEQRRFWREADSGIDLRPERAAAMLLLQAKAGARRDQRLLAVRSLGVLGTASALPYLIELIHDADAELAGAARAAIASIHQRAESPRDAGK